MNLPEDTLLAYILTSEAWYAKALNRMSEPPQMIVVAAALDGKGQDWEFIVEEYCFSNPPRHPDAVRVCVFEDAFDAYVQIPEFFALLAERRPTSLREVREILDGLGAVDRTERARRRR